MKFAMASGLIALLDDVAAIAKVAAASLDDVAAQTLKAGSKAAGIVIDDTAVTPRYVVGFTADRELPIIARIAAGSLRNKLFILLPGALLLSWAAPWAITPLLMAGGLFLCFEGYEKVHELVVGHPPVDDGATVSTDPRALENEKVAGAIRTDMILSAEIMAISLATVADAPILDRVIALVAIAFGITGLVYGAVALIVKADDAGLWLARRGSAPLRSVGRALVVGMPGLLKGLSLVGTVAMLWVGGGIVLHGLDHFGVGPVHALLHGLHEVASAAVPVAAGFAAWFAEASVSALVGLALGFVVALAVRLVAQLRGTGGAH